ncbi:MULTISPECIES: IucA/IucC family protein [unclassified Lysobacter]|uniref:IucA/IucC family protein n=1 Tax=unclassified Lysobacter TaxID=2635362 RepID=UPI001BEA341D|nr:MULTISPECIES: IucA/IucC family protein [unclassified Lysobacter]MBT2747407.1 iron transporter [Lysobacter sp. ISL-42]MBT2750834.1 iron transporter [Lysobacter sp. ISL-50]MBT2778295.1 iron transporter [Lysobacter sp. ISL-54]MBT2784041.1 iron transporter [Lysobacter sp. ISL-52]
MSRQTMHEQWYDGQAQANAIECWLNCYLREFAIPRGEVDFDYRGQDRPARFDQGGGALIRLRFAQPGYRLMVRAQRGSRLGRCEYAGSPYLKSPGEPWRSADAATLIHFLLDRLADECGFNHELQAQCDNSIAVNARLLALAADARESGNAMLDAEQGMVWGHALHPTPKSREGIDIEQALACSPEARSEFLLYWFRVDPRLLQRHGADVTPVLAKLSGEDHLYPCHPWEVERVLANPVWQRARAQGLIEPLGGLGEALAPTSSVRTMYHPQADYFLKMSIHVRLTNCVRKNAWYELESAVALTDLLASAWDDVRNRATGFDVLLEPAATTLDFAAAAGEGDEADVRELGESFGILYRNSFQTLVLERYRPQVAGALFARDRLGNSVCRELVERYARHHGGGYAHAAEIWFAAYAKCLLDGVWLAFFKHGIVLEPHLQNTLIGFNHDLPARVWVRDLEGTKLVAEQWPPERLQGWSERARQSVQYSRELGWNRVAYCALINNLAEAMFHIAAGDSALEDRLWSVVGALAVHWQERFGRQPLLQGLVEGDALPSKNNLRTRVFKRADRDSDYTALANPIRVWAAAEEAA